MRCNFSLFFSENYQNFVKNQTFCDFDVSPRSNLWLCWKNHKFHLIFFRRFISFFSYFSVFHIIFFIQTYISGKSILLVRGDFLKKSFTHFLFVDRQIHTGSASWFVWKNVFLICWIFWKGQKRNCWQICAWKLDINCWRFLKVFGLKVAQFLNLFVPMTKKCPRSCQETHWFGLGVMAHKNVKNSFFVPIGFTRDIHDTTAKRGRGRNQISAVWETMI